MPCLALTTDSAACATHESGHCLAALRFGGEIVRVVVNPDGRSGSCKLGNALKARDRVFYTLAGGAAESATLGVPKLSTLAADFREAESALVVAAMIAGVPAVHLFAELEDELTTWLADSVVRRQLVKLSAALLRQGSLTGDEVSSVLER